MLTAKLPSISPLLLRPVSASCVRVCVYALCRLLWSSSVVAVAIADVSASLLCVFVCVSSSSSPFYLPGARLCYAAAAADGWR